MREDEVTCPNCELTFYCAELERLSTESPALERLYWFYMMVQNGGPDGSELDAAVCDDAEQAANSVTQTMVFKR